MLAHRFEKYYHSNGDIGVRFRTHSDILVWSEGLSSQRNADNNIRTIKQNGPCAPIVDLANGETSTGYRWEIDRSTNGQFFTRFRASNGEIVVHSETYPDKRNAISCANSVKTNAAEAPVIDLTASRVA